MTLWFLARAAGFVALLAATVTVTLGALGSAARPAGSRVDPGHLDRRVLAQLVHRSAAVLALAMLALHGLLLVADRFVPLSWTGALVPFTAGYRPVALGLGTLALYGLAVVAVSGALRGRLVAHSPHAADTWRAVHVSAYAAWALALGHGILAGTDTRQGWATGLYIACAACVAVAAGVRARSMLRHARSPLPEARRLAHTPAGRP